MNSQDKSPRNHLHATLDVNNNHTINSVPIGTNAVNLFPINNLQKVIILDETKLLVQSTNKLELIDVNGLSTQPEAGDNVVVSEVDIIDVCANRSWIVSALQDCKLRCLNIKTCDEIVMEFPESFCDIDFFGLNINDKNELEIVFLRQFELFAFHVVVSSEESFRLVSHIDFSNAQLFCDSKFKKDYQDDIASIQSIL